MTGNFSRWQVFAIWLCLLGVALVVGTLAWGGLS
jgi:hypothetical protein